MEEITARATGLDRATLDRVRYALSSQGHAYSETRSLQDMPISTGPAVSISVEGVEAVAALAEAMRQPPGRPGVVYRGGFEAPGKPGVRPS
jgi:hypothetical protein